MKFAACLLIATFVVAAHAAPAAEQEQLVRAVRQTAGQLPANDPLSQLLQDSLLVSLHCIIFIFKGHSRSFQNCKTQK